MKSQQFQKFKGKVKIIKLFSLILKRLFIQDVRSQKGLSSADILWKGERGVLQMRTSALFGAKNIEFFEIYSVSARTRGEGGLSQCGHFADKREFHLFLCRKFITNYKQIIYVKHQIFYGGFLVRGSEVTKMSRHRNLSWNGRWICHLSPFFG